MREITFAEAIEIAVRRRDMPLFVLYNGLRGDFNSLRSLGIIGQLEEDKDGYWRINTGHTSNYLLPNSAVWVG